ncbi:MAG: helix-turn-helix transcriptional regulator [Lachnospiraceae bacterium]|nr:helix-turn-helix transcriptional regulator [Lachnospiraceae bacterium]
MNVKDAVAIRFQQICKERNMTLNELANLSGVTPSTLYSMMDKRRRDISLLTIKKFCDGLEMSLTEFFQNKIFDELEPEIK